MLLRTPGKLLIIRAMKLSSGKATNLFSVIDVISPYFKRYLPRLIAGFLALVAVDILQLLIPRVIKWAVDDLKNGAATAHSLLRYATYIVALALAVGIMRFCWRHLILGFSRLLEMHLRNRIISHVLRLDRAFFLKKTTGDVMALMTNDLMSVQLACGMGLVAFADAIIMTTAAISFMVYINPKLTLIAILPMPVLAITTKVLTAKLHFRFKKVQETFSKLTEFARSSISTIRLIKAYNQEAFQSARFGSLGREYIRDNLKLATIHGLLFPLSIFTANLSMLLVIYFGGKLAIRGTITTGDFVAFISYLFMLSWPMMAIGWVTNLFQRGITSLDRIKALLAERPSITVLKPIRNPGRIRRRIKIENLRFSYPQSSREVLKGINLEISRGVLGIVGKTGSGKTTLCNLIARIYPVKPGSLFLDGVDINNIPVEDVRKAIAYVPQEAVIFSDTIAANIAIGKPGATMHEIQRAAKNAAIHDEILKMPNQYETRVGEKGVRLSGGQKQRLAMARAFLADRPILIIDDALSAVDMETEQEIIRAITKHLAGKTCIIVSHRIAPLVLASEIAVMDDGKIVARGDHETLMKKSLFYATVYRNQAELKCVEKGI